MKDMLSGIELYYTEPKNVSGDSLSVIGEDTHHITNVMRHAEGDRIYVTNGAGRIFATVITSVSKSEITAQIKETFEYSNSLSNITFCIPRLKSADRMEFALEKCVELGITNFIVFQSNRSVAKGSKLERWNKIIVAAMKQSLRSYLPNIRYMEKFNLLNELSGKKVVFDQEAASTFSGFIPAMQKDKTNEYCFIFGPEGGLTDDELHSLENSVQLKLTDNRLRSETAIVTAAGLLSSHKE